MKNNYMALNIPEYLARKGFKCVGAKIAVQCKDYKYYVPIPSFTEGSQMGCKFFKMMIIVQEDRINEIN